LSYQEPTRIFTPAWLEIHRKQSFTRSALRKQLKVNNHRLGIALIELEEQGVVIRSTKGWSSAESGKRGAIQPSEDIIREMEKNNHPKQSFLLPPH
jgi:hypothetical protein